MKLNRFPEPWTNSERATLLNSITQGAVPDINPILLQTILDNNIQPRWNDIALPEGMLKRDQVNTQRTECNQDHFYPLRKLFDLS